MMMMMMMMMMMIIIIIIVAVIMINRVLQLPFQLFPYNVAGLLHNRYRVNIKVDVHIRTKSDINGIYCTKDEQFSMIS